MQQTINTEQMVIHPILLPYQVKWAMDQSPVAVSVKSRRVGISWTEAAVDVYGAALGVRGWDTWYTGYNKEMAAEFINDCAWWARLFNVMCSDLEEQLITEDGKEIIKYSISFPNGRRINALSSHPRNFRNKKGRLVIDEAGHVDNLAEMIKAAMAVLMWGGQVRIISTHNGELNQFRRLQLDILEGKLPHSLHETTLDDALADGLFKRICMVNDKEWSPEAEAEFRSGLIARYAEHAQEELFCVPSQSKGAYFNADLVRSCMTGDGQIKAWTMDNKFMLWSEEARTLAAREWFHREVLPVLATIHPNSRYVFGQDFGRDRDQTVITIGERTPQLGTRIPLQIELSNIPFDQQREILFWTLDKLPNFSGGKVDRGGNGAYLAEKAVQRWGERQIEAVDLSRPWYAQHFPPLKARMERREIEFPKHESILDDFSKVEMIDGIPQVNKKRSKGERGETRHGDSAVAMVLMDARMKEITGDVRATDAPVKKYETVQQRTGASFGGSRGTW